MQKNYPNQHSAIDSRGGRGSESCLNQISLSRRTRRRKGNRSQKTQLEADRRFPHPGFRSVSLPGRSPTMASRDAWEGSVLRSRHWAVATELRNGRFRSLLYPMQRWNRGALQSRISERIAAPRVYPTAPQKRPKAPRQFVLPRSDPHSDLRPIQTDHHY